MLGHIIATNNAFLQLVYLSLSKVSTFKQVDMDFKSLTYNSR